MKKIDLMGEYEADAIPFEFQMPVEVNGRNNDIHFANGKIVGLYNFSHERTEVIKAKRRAEFLCRIANGEIIVRNGKVWKKENCEGVDGEAIVLTYVPIDKVSEPEIVAQNGHLEPVPAVVEAVQEVAKKRGRPKGWKKK